MLVSKNGRKTIITPTKTGILKKTANTESSTKAVRKI
jgi:hypothetical protein